MKHIILPRLLAATFAAVLSTTAASAITTHFTDFIADYSREGFMGFEALPATDPFSGAPITHQEGGLSIEQVNGQTDDIWTTYFTPEGERGWYPNGGDYGYTRLTLSSGADFQNIGFLLGSGYWMSSSFATYALYRDGDVVLKGSMELFGSTPFYLGFGGGGFDEVRLRDQLLTPGDFRSKTENGLAIDAIEISVPDQGAYALCMIGVLSALAYTKRRWTLATARD